MNETKNPPLTDLRNITRYPKRCKTIVNIKPDSYEAAVTWLVAGQVELFHMNDRRDGRYSMEARIAGDITDPSHDSLIVFRLPLVGVQFDGIPIYYHTAQIIAWVDPDESKASRDFCVPGPDYNPSKVKGVERCKCTPKGHLMVPDGHYVPKFDADLYKLVRGKRLEINIGPVYSKEED